MYKKGDWGEKLTKNVNGNNHVKERNEQEGSNRSREREREVKKGRKGTAFTHRDTPATASRFYWIPAALSHTHGTPLRPGCGCGRGGRDC